MRSIGWLFTVCLLTAAAGACGDSSTGPPPPEPGTFDVLVTLPNADDQVMLLNFSTQLSNFSPAAGFEHYLNVSTTSTTLLVVAAAPLPAGEKTIGSFGVPDVAAFTSRSGMVSEAAASSYQLRTSLSGYTVRLQRR